MTRPGHWDYVAHPGDCCPRTEPDGTITAHCRECAGTGVFPMPWLDSVSDGLADMPDSSCITCKGFGRQIVTFAAAPQP